MSSPSESSSRRLKPADSSELRVPLSAPCYGPGEIEEVLRVLRSGWWTYGPVTRRLESDLADYFGVRHAIAVANGTAALHLAHVALGVSAGDEVVTPALSFVAASNVILHAGAVPHFCDVDSLDTPLVSATTLARAISPNTRGLCIMHYGGYPCDMGAITEIARHRGLWVIEDAAHAPGALWENRFIGTWGDVGCFSFFGNKNMTCGEGGLVVTQRDDLAEKIRALRSHGMNSLTWDRFRGHQFSYDVSSPGFNYRLDDVRAALLDVQLRSLSRMNRMRSERVDWYRQLLGGDPRWSIPFVNHGGTSSHHLFVVVLAENIPRDAVMLSMRSRGIQTSVHYPPIHQFTCYRRLSLPHSDLAVTEALGRRLLTLPLYPDLTWEQVKFVCDSLREAVSACTFAAMPAEPYRSTTARGCW